MVVWGCRSPEQAVKRSPNQLVFFHAHGSFCRFSLEYHTEEAKGKKKIESQAFSLGSRRRIFQDFNEGACSGLLGGDGADVPVLLVI